MQRRRAVDAVRRRFWVPSAVAIIAALGLGSLLPRVDDALKLDPGLFAFTSIDAVRGMLQVIATVTISVAGVAFSVTVVALQLATQQLGPRVLRTFQTDRVNQATLAALLGPFVYAVVLLTQLDATADTLPHLSLTFAVLLGLAAVAFFVAFVQHIITSLQASTVIAKITTEGAGTLSSGHPRQIGTPADAPPSDLIDDGAGLPVRADRAGYLAEVNGRAVLTAAQRASAVVVQRTALGDYVVTGQLLATLVPLDGRRLDDEARHVDAVRAAFSLYRERTLADDVGFPLRQLADIALRALSPALNDPTTAENAMGAAVDFLVRFAREPAPSCARADDDGALRFVAKVPDLDDLVRLTVDQVRGNVDAHPAVADRLVMLLGHLAATARAHGHPTAEAQRQAELFERSGDDDNRADDT